MKTATVGLSDGDSDPPMEGDLPGGGALDVEKMLGWLLLI